jgi:hypothetical protein
VHARRQMKISLHLEQILLAVKEMLTTVNIFSLAESVNVQTTKLIYFNKENGTYLS